MTPQESAAGLICYLGTLTISACMFWSSPLVTWLSSDESTLNLSSNEVNLIVYIFEVSSILTIYPSGYMASRFGRKLTLSCAYPAGILSFVLALVAVNFTGLLIARLLQGVVVGIILTVGPEYSAETTRDNIRGFAMTMLFTTFAIGGLLTALLGSFLSYTTYSGICLAIPTTCLVLIFFLPESPHYLVMKGDRDRAEKTLKWLRNTENVRAEMEMIESVLKKDLLESSGYVSLFTSSQHRKPLIIGVLTALAANMIGYPAIPTYAFELLPTSSETNLSSKTLAIFINVFTVIGAASVSFLVDNYGRRPLILISSTTCCLFSFMVVIYLLIQDYESPVSIEFSYFLLLGVLGFTVSIVFIQSLQILLQAELFATSVRAEAAVVIQLISSVSALFQLILYPIINEYLGAAVNFLLYLIYSSAFLWCMWYLMPETAGQFLGKMK